jgi:localization factor PodJL
MSAQSSWSLRGVDPRARDIVRSAAKREGVTIGEWLSRQLLDDDLSGLGGGDEALIELLDRLTRRIEAADKSVNTVISRLAGAEQLQIEFSGRCSTALDELRDTQEALQTRIERMERTGGDGGGIDALKTLEQTLAEVAEKVSANEAETRAALDALKAELKRLGARPDGRLDAASRALDQRIAKLERRIAADFSKIADTVAKEVESAARRLGRDLEAKAAKAGSAAGSAIKELEGTFAALDARLRQVESEIARLAESRVSDAFAADVEQRLQGLSRELADVVAATRAETAGQTAAAADESAGALKSQIASLKRETTASEIKQRKALARLSAKVAKLASAVETHVRETGTAARPAGDGAAEIARIEARLAQAEETSASAVEAVSRRVDALNLRTGDLSKDLDRRLRESEMRARALADEAARSRRPDAPPAAMSSPVQLALDALRARLAALETTRDAAMGPGPASDEGADELDAPPSLDADPGVVSELDDELLTGKALDASENAGPEDRFAFVYGRSVAENDASGDDTPSERLAPRPGLRLVRARETISQASQAKLGETDVPPGFGPAAAPAVKTRKTRGLLYAAGGLAVIAVGAAGMTVVADPGSPNAARNGAGDPLEGFFATPTPRIAPEAAVIPPSLEAAISQDIAAPASAAAEEVAPPSPLLDTSSDIARLQAALTKLGHRVGRADGVMGPRTARAVLEYQRAEGLPVTGVIDAALLEKLEAEAADR